MKLLTTSDDVNGIIGQISPPVPAIPDDPQLAIGNFLGVGIKIFLMVGCLILLIFLLMGAIDWIGSGGDKEKLAKAQQKIINAVVGILIMIVALTIFRVITVNILHIFCEGGFFEFKIPTIDDPTTCM